MGLRRGRRSRVPRRMRAAEASPRAWRCRARPSPSGAADAEAYVGARTVECGQKAATERGARFVQLDVTDDASVAAATTTTAIGVTQAALASLRSRTTRSW
jgi:hypothetical protein